MRSECSVRRLPVGIGAWALLFWALLIVTPSADVWASPGAGATPPLGMGACKRDCRGRVCGGDGCGGSCGTCRAGSGCYKNRCVKAPKGDPCVAMTGRWSGVMPATRRHRAAYLKGRIWGTVTACRARFRVSYQTSSGSNKVVIEYFKVTVGKVGTKGRRRATFVCTKLTVVSSGTSYSKDTFMGTLSYGLTRFRGTTRDTAGSTSRVRLNKK